MNKKTICNPVNINYQYQDGYFSRESADPAVVLYGDEYYLFASHGSGYWVSSDLAEWEFIAVNLEKQPEFNLFAPAPVVVGNRIYLTHSQGGHILYSDNPRDPDSWVDIGKPFPAQADDAKEHRHNHQHRHGSGKHRYKALQAEEGD